MTNFVVVAIFKNETKNLVEWIEHYIWQGAKHFYLCDNDSNDNPLEILQPYIDKKIITYWIDTRHPSKMEYKYNIQIEAYKYIVDKIQNLDIPPEWILICDLDEFWYGRKTTIKSTLSIYPESVHLIMIGWYTFGPSTNDLHPESLRKELVYRREIKGSPKYMFRTMKINYMDIHAHNIDNISSENTIWENDNLQLNHYICQSREYWETIKIPRGYIIGDLSVYSGNYFEENSEGCVILDNELSNQVSSLVAS